MEFNGVNNILKLNSNESIETESEIVFNIVESIDQINQKMLCEKSTTLKET